MDYINQTKIQQPIKIERYIYSDHNSILIHLYIETPTEEQRPKKIITKKGYKRYRTIIAEENVSKLLRSGDLQESYNKWSIAIETSIKTVPNKNKKSKVRYQGAAKN